MKEDERDYRGLCSTKWKDRWAVHNQHMNHREHRTKCELAKYVWGLKDENKDFDISWKILKKVCGKMVGGHVGCALQKNCSSLNTQIKVVC